MAGGFLNAASTCGGAALLLAKRLRLTCSLNLFHRNKSLGPSCRSGASSGRFQGSGLFLLHMLRTSRRAFFSLLFYCFFFRPEELCLFEQGRKGRYGPNVSLLADDKQSLSFSPRLRLAGHQSSLRLRPRRRTPTRTDSSPSVPLCFFGRISLPSRRKPAIVDCQFYKYSCRSRAGTRSELYTLAGPVSAGASGTCAPGAGSVLVLRGRLQPRCVWRSIIRDPPLPQLSCTFSNRKVT